MKDQAQQPPDANPTARPTTAQYAGANPMARGASPVGAAVSGAQSTPSTPAQPSTPASAPQQPLFNLPQANAASQNTNGDSTLASAASFAQQGFAGVGGQPPTPTMATPLLGPGALQGPRDMDTNGTFLPSGPLQPPRAMDTAGTLPGNISASTRSNEAATSYGPLVQHLDSSRESLLKAMGDQRDASYRQATAYLDPQWNTQQQQLETKLANEGVMQNSEAWNKAMDAFQRQRTFAYQQAQDAAVSQGNAAAAQLFGENLSGAQLTNSAQSQMAQQILAALGINTQAATTMGVAGIQANTAANQLGLQRDQQLFDQDLTLHRQDLSDLQLQQMNPLQLYTLLTQGASPTNPNFAQTPGANVAGTDIAGIIAQALGQQNNVYNAQTGASNSQNSAMASIAAAAIIGAMFGK